MNFDIPETITYKLSDAEKFKIGFEQLCSACKVSRIGAIQLGALTYFQFNDGSTIGVKNLTSKYLNWK